MKQDQDLIKFITSRHSKLENDKSNFNDRMQDVADFVCPHRDDILGNMVPGEKKGSKIYDGTAVGAAVLAADGIHGYHVSPAFPWFKYLINVKEINKIPEVREWLQDGVEYGIYSALNRSNFYAEMWSEIYDGLTLGTAPIFAEEDLSEERIVFESVHPGEVFISENKYGDVDVLHRKRKLTARKLMQMFGKENLPDSITTSYDNAPFQEYEIIHAVYPREDYNDRLKDGESKKFASVWYLKNSNHICRVHGFDKFPYQVWRYLKSGKEPYGISPAMLAMADIKGLQLMGKTILGAAQLAVDPAYNIPSYLQGKVQLKPRGQNFIREANDRITAINTGSGYPVGIDREQAKQRSIEKRFHVDTFLMLAQLEGRGQRTAYEVSEMMAEKAAVLGAELGPLNTEIDHLLERVFDIESNAGRIPPPPDILQELAREDKTLRFDPLYMGPLAQNQREKFGKEGIRKFFLDIAPLVQLKPEVLDKIDFDSTIDILADINNTPHGVLMTSEAVAAIRQGRLQAQQQDTMMEGLASTLKGAKTASEADKNMDGQMAQNVNTMMEGANV